MMFLSLNTKIMKKFISLFLLALPFVFGATSCSDDDDLPDVSISVSLENAKKVDGVIYVVQGDTLKITSINVKNNEAGKNAAITEAEYFWDYIPLQISIIPPYGISIPTSKDEGDVAGTPLGNHLLQIKMPLLAEDKELATAMLVYTVKVVATPEEIPSEPADVPGETPTITKANK